MKKRGYRVLKGVHYEQEGRKQVLYEEGSIVMSVRPLHKRFKNKFAPVGEDEQQEVAVSKKRRRGSKKVEDDATTTDPAPVLRMDHLGSNKYDVINSNTGDPVNDEPLTKEEAEILVFGS